MKGRSVGVVFLILITIVLAGAAIVIGDQLAKRNTNPDDTSACITCGGGTCPDGYSYPGDNCAPQATCEQRHNEACQNHQGSGGDGGTGGDGGGGTTNDCTGKNCGAGTCFTGPNANDGGWGCNCNNGTTLGPSTNPGTCPTSDGGTGDGGGGTGGNKVAGQSCTPGQEDPAQGGCDGAGPLSCCTCTCTDGSRPGICGSNCNGQSIAQACSVACTDSGARCSNPDGGYNQNWCDSSCGAGRGRVCQFNGTWSPCVRSDACGTVGNQPNGGSCLYNSSCLSGCCDTSDNGEINCGANGQQGTCTAQPSNVQACSNYPGKWPPNFLGCADAINGGDPCVNCFLQRSGNSGPCTVFCDPDSALSCGTRLQCDDFGGTVAPTQQPDGGGDGGDGISDGGDGGDGDGGVSYCGDGVLNPGESCEPGSTTYACTGGATCNQNCQCQTQPYCGDGVLNAGEQCDPGSTATNVCSGTQSCNPFGCNCTEDIVCGSDCTDTSQCPSGMICGTSGQCENPGCTESTCIEQCLPVCGGPCDGVNVTCPDGLACNTSTGRCVREGAITNPNAYTADGCGLIGTIPDTAIISDDVDRVVFAIVVIVTGALVIRLNAFEKLFNTLGFFPRGLEQVQNSIFEGKNKKLTNEEVKRSSGNRK